MKIFSVFLFVFSVLIASFSQILLKKGSQQQKIFFNKYALCGYFIMFLSTIFTLISYKAINLSFGGILQSFSYIFVLILSYVFLKEKISTKMFFGIFIIVVGAIVYSI